jgi:hypothetical protein
MRDSSAVMIQLLDIVTERMIYSSHGDVKDCSGSFSMYVPYLRMVAPSHGEGVAEAICNQGLGQ